MNKIKTKKAFSLPEVIISISVIVLVIITATNLLVTSMRANTSNVNKIIAFNLAQEAIEGFRNVRDGYWMHNQYWRGSEKNLFGTDFIKDGKYIIKKQHNLKTLNDCSVLGLNASNTVGSVSQASPWQVEKYNDQNSILYLKEGDVTQYTHEHTQNESKYKRWIEVSTILYDLVTEENEEKLKISLTAVVEWTDKGKTRELRVPTILTDWKAGPL
ncbi:hypothetical protein ACFLZH_01830 [Patescibacteria group bacterium]